MLSYLHEFHAGNHADILKHLALVFIFEHLNEKGKPYTFFDTHAGAGLYRFDDERALKTGESMRGIQRLLDYASRFSDDVPSEMQGYLSLVKKYAADGMYPGSPVIESDLLGNGSILVASELHSAEFDVLQKTMRGRAVQLHHRNGWEMLRALTPPAIKRGAVLCDPSYEEKQDYTDAAKTLCDVHKKWPAATLALWYPLLSYRNDIIQGMKDTISQFVLGMNAHTEILDVPFCVDTEDSHIETTLDKSIGSAKPRLYGSGMFVINPPWKLEEKLRRVLPFVAKALGCEECARFSDSR